ncbi:arginine N-succinyltransferase [Sphingomonas bacterium]|uniref:arginine N-succinyltransferase n=1 Tax=Sphingomonas bacterium TaxID=1895847 RepID=UPI0020C64BED|nr:arginine N-succinyltransferase [Sphingomonas bacterium]
MTRAVPTPVIRIAQERDVDAVLRLAVAGGQGLTNLPPDRAALAKRIAASERAVAGTAGREEGSAVLLVAEFDDEIVATGMIFARVGAEWPFYSYRITRQASLSQSLGRSKAQRMLNLVNDFDGETEVGGLFVDPARRGLALGRLMARARYLFIARHRSWFHNRVIAELRGYQDEAGRAPVWEAIGRHFYDMDFHEADRTGAIHGNQFIADFGPRHPIYLSMLPADAQAAFGRPHDDGRRARDMLLTEGFRDECYVDIFDGGPTLVADIDAVRTVRQAEHLAVAALGEADELVLASAGEAETFRAASGKVRRGAEGLTIEPSLAAALGVGRDDALCLAPA